MTAAKQKRGPGRPRKAVADAAYYPDLAETVLEPAGARRGDAQLVMRLPKEMKQRLTAYAQELSAELRVPVSVAAAGRLLIDNGLAAAGHPKVPF